MSRARSRAPARFAGLVRLAVAFFASLVALGYFAAVSHMVFVAHAACAEHGELVHVHGATESAAGDADAEGRSALPGGSLASDEHDHCPIGAAQPSDARVARAALAVVLHDEPPALAPPIAVQAPPRHLVALAPPIDLLLLSPKSSPPV